MLPTSPSTPLTLDLLLIWEKCYHALSPSPTTQHMHALRGAPEVLLLRAHGAQWEEKVLARQDGCALAHATRWG